MAPVELRLILLGKLFEGVSELVVGHHCRQAPTALNLLYNVVLIHHYVTEHSTQRF